MCFILFGQGRELLILSASRTLSQVFFYIVNHIKGQIGQLKMFNQFDWILWEYFMIAQQLWAEDYEVLQYISFKCQEYIFPALR